MDNNIPANHPAAPADLFSHEYINAKSLYLYLTGNIPSVSFMGDIDPFSAIAAFRKAHDNDIEHWYNEAVWSHDKQGFGMENTFFVLKNKMILHFGHNFVHMIHSMDDWEYIETLSGLFAPFRTPASE